MHPTLDFFDHAEKQIRECLERLRPKLLEAQGSIEHRLKDDDTAVTEMDTFVEAELREAMQRLDPTIGFGGEEGGVNFDQRTFWLADPIDGTEAFIRGLPFATNMIALIDNNEPVMSVIYNFSLGDFYLAKKGYGATCNGHPIHVSNRQTDRAWVMLNTEMSDPRYADISAALAKKVNRIRRYAGAGFDYAVVASGAMEARLQYHGHGFEWDYAPGTLLVQEAGGIVANVGLGTYDYRKFDHLAANAVVFDELARFLADADTT